MDNERQELAKEVKRQRIPVGASRHNLQVSKEDEAAFKHRGKHAHWFNDHNGRVQAAQAGGYTFVNQKDVPSLGGSVHLTGENDALDSKVSKQVSRSGDPLIAYLMEIDLLFYNEDKATKEAAVDAKERTLLDPVELGGQSIEQGYTPK